MQDEIESALRRFVVDNRSLEQLEALLDDFNPFVAVGWTRQETRHSAFLRWILDPAETHGVGDYFLRLFLKHVTSITDTLQSLSSPTVFDVDGWRYSGAAVLTEWKNIDLLIRDDVNECITLIENKIDSKEHSNQLARYRAIVEQAFPSYKQIYIYLTPTVEAPSDESYIALKYADIVWLLEEMLDRREDQIGSEVRLFIRQYVDMLRRHIVEDSQIQELCRQIYTNHRRALDVLFEHRPDRALELSKYLQQYIADDPRFVLDNGSKSYIHFLPRDLDFIPKLGTNWTRTKRMLLFELDQSSATSLRFKLIVGPGNAEVRDAICRYIKEETAYFNRLDSKVYSKFWTFHTSSWIGKKKYALADGPELIESARKRLEHFIEADLPQVLEELVPLQETIMGALDQ